MRAGKFAAILALAAGLSTAASRALAFPATAFGDWSSIEVNEPWAQGYVGLAAALEIMKGVDVGDRVVDPGPGRPPLMYRDLYEMHRDDPYLIPPTYEGTGGLLARRDFGYLPALPFTRAQAAAAVARAGLGVFGGPLPLEPGVPAFADVDRGAWYAPYVHALQNEGIVNIEHYRDGPVHRFWPDRPITRGELASWIGQTLKHEGVEPADLAHVRPMKWTNPQKSYRAHVWEDLDWHWVRLPRPVDVSVEFADLPPDYPGYEAIRHAVRLGIASGYEREGRRIFEPDRPVSRLEAAVMLVVLANLLTDDPPEEEHLLAVLARAEAIVSTVEKSIRPEMSYREILETYRKTDLSRYLTEDAIYADGGLVAGSWAGRRNPRSGARHRIVASRPVFLGKRFAILEVVDAVSSPLFPGRTAYYGAMYFFVRDREGWKSSDVVNPGDLPRWWSRDHCDESGRCSE